MREKIVIALGGNALQSGKEAATAEAQLKTVKETAERIAEICERGSEIAVVHGNGPQVGRILLASETAKEASSTKRRFSLPDLPDIDELMDFISSHTLTYGTISCVRI